MCSECKYKEYFFCFFRFKANSRKVKFVVSSLPSDEAFPIKFTDFQVQVLYCNYSTVGPMSTAQKQQTKVGRPETELHWMQLLVHVNFILSIHIRRMETRKGKGHHCCLGGRIYSIPCCAFAAYRMNSSFSFKSSWCNSSFMIHIIQYKIARVSPYFVVSYPVKF